MERILVVIMRRYTNTTGLVWYNPPIQTIWSEPTPNTIGPFTLTISNETTMYFLSTYPPTIHPHEFTPTQSRKKFQKNQRQPGFERRNPLYHGLEITSNATGPFAPTISDEGIAYFLSIYPLSNTLSLRIHTIKNKQKSETAGNWTTAESFIPRIKIDS